MITLAFTVHEWAAFGMGAGFMLVLVIIAVAILLGHWGRTIPPEFRGKPPEHQNCRCVPGFGGVDELKTQGVGMTPAVEQELRSAEKERRAPWGIVGREFQAGGQDADSLSAADRDRMMNGRFENTPAAIESAIFVFVATDGRTTRTLIDYKAALRMLCAQYVTEDTGKQVQKLTDLTAGKCGCVSVIGGMLERPLRMGESSPSRPLPPAGRDGGSPLRNHPELAEDPSYVRQCIGSAMQGEDFAARTGRIPELFEFRTGPESRGRLLTRKNAERMAGQHFPERAAADIVASLARGATSSINVGVGTITRFEPVKAS